MTDDELIDWARRSEAACNEWANGIGPGLVASGAEYVDQAIAEARRNAGIYRAIAARLEEVRRAGWVRCADRMPEDGQLAWVHSPRWGMTMATWFTHSQMWVEEDRAEPASAYTHWYPTEKPESPNE